MSVASPQCATKQIYRINKMCARINAKQMKNIQMSYKWPGSVVVVLH